MSFSLQPSTFSYYLPTTDRDRVIYVDSVNGSDTNRGNLIIDPVKTLSFALSRATNNSLIVLQDGNYGSATVANKDIQIMGAFGANPIVTSITGTDCSFKFYNVGFTGASIGVSLTNTALNRGSVSLRKCTFSNQGESVGLIRVSSVSIHQNKFISCDRAVRIYSGDQAVISSNYVDDSKRAIDIFSVPEVDISQNTINRSAEVDDIVIPGGELHVVFHEIVAQDLVNKYFQMPRYLLHVAINVVYGPSFALNTDFIFSGNVILWSGLGMDGDLNVGDILRIMYSRTNPPYNDPAILLVGVGPVSRVDSNNLTNANLGVFFSNDIKITNNNFYNTTTPYHGGTPFNIEDNPESIDDVLDTSGDPFDGDYENTLSTIVSTAVVTDGSGNITGNPLYIDSTPGSSNFHLQAGSASIEKANPNKWDQVLSEMSSSWGSVSFNRNIDGDGVNRFQLGKITGDIGSYEYVTGAYTPGVAAFVGEEGYDFSYFGTQSKPFVTPDKAFLESGVDPVKLIVGTATGLLSSNTGRFTINNLELSGASFDIGTNRSKDYAVLNTSYPALPDTNNVYVSEDVGGDPGDGSFLLPFTSIDTALGEVGKPNVILIPGRHKRFTQGVAGKRIISLKRTEYSSSTKKTYNYFNIPGWAVVTNVPGSTVLTGKELTFNLTTVGGTSKATSTFTLDNNADGIEVLFKAQLGTDFGFKIYTTPVSTELIPPDYPSNTSDNSLFVTLVGTELVLGYSKIFPVSTVPLQSSFPTYYTVTTSSVTVNVRFVLKGASFKLTAKGAGFDLVREGTFDRLYDGATLWKAEFSADTSTAVPSLVGSSNAFNLKIIAGGITATADVGVYPNNTIVGKGPSILVGS